jgi:hypothetical protein
MDATPKLDDDLVAKSLAELADAAYQIQVWAGRVVFTVDIDDQLLRLRELLEAVDTHQPIRAMLSDPSLVEARLLASGILR